MATRLELATAAKARVRAAMSAPGASFRQIGDSAGVRSDVVRRLFNDDYLPLRGAGRVTTASLVALAKWEGDGA